MLQLNEEFEKIEWKRIPETFFVTKYKFEAGYFIVITDLTHVYEEKMSEDEIQERFHALNPHVEMKTKVILKNLQQCLDDHLDHNKSTILLKSFSDRMDLKLKFHINEVSSYFEMKLNLLPAEKMLKYVLAPVILNACIYRKKYWECKKTEEHGKLHESPLLTTNKSRKSVQFDSEWLITNNIPVESIMKSFLEAQGNFYDLASETSSKESKNPSITAKLPTPQADRQNASSYVPIKQEIHPSDSSSASINFENIEKNPSPSIKTEQEKNTLKHEARKVKKKKINI